MFSREFDYSIALHTRHATMFAIRGLQHAVLHRKQIAHGAAYDAFLCIAHESFGDGGIVPFRARQDILQAVQAFDASGCG